MKVIERRQIQQRLVELDRRETAVMREAGMAHPGTAPPLRLWLTDGEVVELMQVLAAAGEASPAQHGSEPDALVDRIMLAVCNVHDGSDLWAHTRRDPDAFRRAIATVLAEGWSQ